MKRPLKQFLYGSLYLAVFALVIYVGYLAVIFCQPATCFDGRQNQGETGVDCGGSCVPCGLQFVKNIATSTPEIFEIDPNRVSFIGEIKNPNLDFGAEEFSYTINLYDFGGRRINSRRGTSFIYPSEVKNIIEPLIETPFRDIARSELLIDNVSWLPIEEFEKPEVEVSDYQTESTDDGVLVSGLVVNNSAFRLRQVGVSAIIFNRSGLRLGISRTSIQDIEPFGQKTFSITIPVSDSASVDPRLTKAPVEAKK